MLKSWLLKLSLIPAFFAGTLFSIELGDVSPDIYQRIADKNRMDVELIRKMAPFLYPAYKVDFPVGQGLELGVPSELGNQKLANLGYVDVTAAPFNADPSGKSDCTKLIQKAANYARDHQMALFFPLGTYAVSDTLMFIQYNMLRDGYGMGSAFNHANVIVGSSADPKKRPTIYLMPNSPGFDNPNDRKICVHIPKDSKDRGFGNHDSGENYNQSFRNINITIGEGNSGAIGIRMQAAEGSSIQDVTIDATHGHTGMQGAAGSGGSHHNIMVIGGRVGIDTRGFPPEFQTNQHGTQPSPTLSQITLIGQTEAALIHQSRGPLTVVALKVKSSIEGPVIINNRNTQKDGKTVSDAMSIDSSISMTDSVIEFEKLSAKNQVISAQRSYYLENVYVKNASRLDKERKIDNPSSGWTRYIQCAIANNPAPVNGLQPDETPIINGILEHNGYIKTAQENPPADILSRHSFGIAPSFETKGVCIVTDPAYGAKADGVADDTAALQKAIDENEIVFLPRGYYRVMDTIRLKPNTKLIGVMHHLSVIMANEPFGKLNDVNNPLPLVETADDPSAQTYLAFVGIYVPAHAFAKTHPSDTVDCYALKWQSGRNSVMRSCSLRRIDICGPGSSMPKGFVELRYTHPLMLVTGNGGGKVYNFFIHNGKREAPSYRHIFISNSTEPLTFYQVHAQHSGTAAMIEITGAKSVTTFGMKSENNTRFIIARNSGKIHLHGHGGIATPKEGTSEYLFEGVEDLLFSNCADQLSMQVSSKNDKGHQRNNAKSYSELFDFYKGEKEGLEPLQRPILYHRVK